METYLGESGSEMSLGGIGIGENPESSGEKVEADLESGEDANKDEIGSESADEEDGAKDTHEKEEEGERSVEANSSQTISSNTVGGSVESISSESGNQGTAIREPETTKGAEDGSGEAVSENPFEDTTDDHEETTHEDVDTTKKSMSEPAHFSTQLSLFLVLKTYLLAAPLPPAPRHPIKSQERGVKAKRKPTRALE